MRIILRSSNITVFFHKWRFLDGSVNRAINRAARVRLRLQCPCREPASMPPCKRKRSPPPSDDDDDGDDEEEEEEWTMEEAERRASAVCARARRDPSPPAHVERFLFPPAHCSRRRGSRSRRKTARPATRVYRAAAKANGRFATPAHREGLRCAAMTVARPLPLATLPSPCLRMLPAGDLATAR